MPRYTTSSRKKQPAQQLAGGTGIAFVAGAVTAASLILGRKAVTAAKVGKGHPLKHRMLDVASGAMQTKYPLAAMSTYLNGFHMYADDMGRQVEASHFCIHLRPDLHECVIFDRNEPDARLIGSSTSPVRSGSGVCPTTRSAGGTATTTRSSPAS